MTVFALSLLTSGVPISMVCAAIGLVFAFFLILSVIRASAGNERMQEIAGAIQEGAKAYLNRQVMTISSIAVVIFILLFIFKDHATAVWFPDWSGLLTGRGLYRNAHRGFGERSHHSGSDQVADSSASDCF